VPEPARREAELAANLAAVRARVAAACTAAGRSSGDVTTVVVTKTFPASDVRLLAGLGVAEVGEAREPEASQKVQECADLGLRWHCVGRLQTNKARSVAGWAAVVHSVDSRRLAAALSRGAAGHGRTVDVLVQVSLDGDPARGGVVVADVPGLADAVADGESLRLAGVMAVAPLGMDASAAFATLADVSTRVRRDHPGAGVVSAGMSADLEAAVACGATHLRVGSAVLGSRPALQ
jgi:hypothetical protein